tara:strand:+ start:667 stop:927 length:261 start_codon:yes stop_codon:yes gene_type:complete
MSKSQNRNSQGYAYIDLEKALGLIWTRALECGAQSVTWEHLEWAVPHLTGERMHYGNTLEILVARWGWMADSTAVYPHTGERENCK